MDDNLPAGARERIARVVMPKRMRGLPTDPRGYAIPKFVEMVNGKYDFRVMDPHHLIACVNKGLCWVCGQPLGRYMTFVVGPMCIVNRTSAEPPSHQECGRYSVQVCPFLAIPEMRRIEHNMPAGHTQAGIGIKRNPGVICLWTVRSYRTMRHNGILFEMGEPTNVEWWTRGRTPATHEEVMESIRTGMPVLERVARLDGPDAVAELGRYYERALRYIPPVAKEDTNERHAEHANH